MAWLSNPYFQVLNTKAPSGADSYTLLEGFFATRRVTAILSNANEQNLISHLCVFLIDVYLNIEFRGVFTPLKPSALKLVSETPCQQKGKKTQATVTYHGDPC